MKTKCAFLIAVLIFVAGSATYLRSAAGHDDQSFIDSPFVITYSRFRRSAPTERRTMVRLVNSRGRSLLKSIGRDGRDLRHTVQQYIRNDWKGWADREGYERSTHVIRKEQFLGITAYVLRQDVGNGEVLEFWHAPETGLVPLKEIVEYDNGDALVTEATSLEFREVSDEELAPQASLLWEFPKFPKS